MAHPLVELCFAATGDDDTAPQHLGGHRPGPRADSGGPVAAPSPATALAALASRIRLGDERAFEQLFRDTYPRLARVAAAYVDGDGVADVVAELFVAIWNRRAEWAPTDVEAFLYRAVRNRALNQLRGEARELRRRNTYHDDSPSALAPVMLTDDDDLRSVAVRLAVTELNARQRELAVLRWQEGRTPAEIAELLGVTVRSVTSLQDRTLAFLRRRAPEILAKLR
jgi:RNA polymerase sigma-70 factor (ECF subfamily)